MGRGSHTVPWADESNPGLGLQPPGPEQHLFLLKRSPKLSGLGMSASRPLPIPGYWDSLVSFQKRWSSKEKFPSRISFPVSKQPTLLAEMSFLPNLHPEGGNVASPHEGPQRLIRLICAGMKKVHILQRLRTPSRPPPALPDLILGQRFRCDPEAGCPQNW